MQASSWLLLAQQLMAHSRLCHLPASGVPTFFQHLANAARVHVITRCNRCWNSPFQCRNQTLTDLPHAGLVLGQAAVNTILSKIASQNVATEVCTVNLGTVVADPAALRFLGHCLAQLVAQHKSRLVGQPQVARHGQHGFAFTSRQYTSTAAR